MKSQHRLTRRLGCVKNARTLEKQVVKFTSGSIESAKNSAAARSEKKQDMNGKNFLHKRKHSKTGKWKECESFWKNQRFDHASVKKDCLILKIHRNCLNFVKIMWQTSTNTKEKVGDFIFGEILDPEKHTLQLQFAMNWLKNIWSKFYLWICLKQLKGWKAPLTIRKTTIQIFLKIWNTLNCLWLMTSELKKSLNGFLNNYIWSSIFVMKTTFRSLRQAINRWKIFECFTNHKLRQDWTKCASLWSSQEKIAEKTNALHFRS